MKDNVAIVTESFWRKRFNSDPGVIGRSIALNGVAHTIVGVLPNLPISWFGRDSEVFIATPFDNPDATKERIMRGLQFHALHRPIEARRHDATSASCDACTRAKLSRAASEKQPIRHGRRPPRRERRRNRRPAAGFHDVAHRRRRGFADCVQQRREPFARSLYRAAARNRVAHGARWRSPQCREALCPRKHARQRDCRRYWIAVSRFGLSKSFRNSPATTSRWKAGSRSICRCFFSRSGFRFSPDFSWDFIRHGKVRAAIWLKA